MIHGNQEETDNLCLMPPLDCVDIFVNLLLKVHILVKLVRSWWISSTSICSLCFLNGVWTHLLEPFQKGKYADADAVKYV